MIFPNCTGTCSSRYSLTNCISICSESCTDACKRLGFTSSHCYSTCGVPCSISDAGTNLYSVSFMTTHSGSYVIAVLVKNIHVHTTVLLPCAFHLTFRSGCRITLFSQRNSFQQGDGFVFRSIIFTFNCNKWPHELIYNNIFRQIL